MFRSQSAPSPHEGVCYGNLNQQSAIYRPLY